MDVVSLRCKATSQSSLEISMDTRATMNSIQVRLESHYHPNRELLRMLDLYGEEGFELSVLEVLHYEAPTEDYTDELETMQDLCLLQDPKAGKLWK